MKATQEIRLNEINEKARGLFEVIELYSDAYSKIEYWQENSNLIPKGDQKTGCIGEFYVFLYLTNCYPSCSLNYGGITNSGWDIEVSSDDTALLKVQVKTISGYSSTRRMSPIHCGWDQLHVVHLDKKFNPVGFWIVQDTSIFRGNKILKNKICPKPNNDNLGSKDIPFGENLIQQLQEAVARFKS